MPQILVWKCANTGRLFEDQQIYKNHLSTLARERRKVKQQNHIKSTFFDWLDNERTNNVFTVSDIPQWLLDNQQIIMDAVNAIPGWSGDRFVDGDLFTKIEFTDIRWNSNLSNSHSCPKGGARNWCGKETFADGTPKPTGYPGWYINLRGSLKRNRKFMSSYPYSGLLNIVGIHTGSGGGGNDDFSYDAKIFAEEWPGVASDMVFRKLGKQVQTA